MLNCQAADCEHLQCPWCRLCLPAWNTVEFWLLVLEGLVGHFILLRGVPFDPKPARTHQTTIATATACPGISDRQGDGTGVHDATQSTSLQTHHSHVWVRSHLGGQALRLHDAGHVAILPQHPQGWKPQQLRWRGALLQPLRRILLQPQRQFLARQHPPAHAKQLEPSGSQLSHSTIGVHIAHSADISTEYLSGKSRPIDTVIRAANKDSGRWSAIRQSA